MAKGEAGQMSVDCPHASLFPRSRCDVGARCPVQPSMSLHETSSPLSQHLNLIGVRPLDLIVPETCKLGGECQTSNRPFSPFPSQTIPVCMALEDDTRSIPQRKETPH